jgi:hypothetical protein
MPSIVSRPSAEVHDASDIAYKTDAVSYFDFESHYG